jgi:Tol biopolymer transport system component
MQPPVWKPDGSALAFIAAQGPESPRGIYVVNVDGSGQHPVIELPSLELRDLAWSMDGNWLFFSNQTIYAVNISTGSLTESLTQFSGYGPDFGSVHSPTKAELYYLKSDFNRETGQKGGVLGSIDTSTLPTVPFERAGAPLYADQIEYSRDGAYLLVGGSGGVWVQDQSLLTSPNIVRDLPVPPQPTFNPAGERVAFLNLDGLRVPQIFVISRQGGEAAQLTFHQDGTISDLNWAAG